MGIEEQGIVAMGVMLAVTIAISIMIVLERRKYDDDFDGGFEHDNRPRVITKIKSNFIEEDNDDNA